MLLLFSWAWDQSKSQLLGPSGQSEAQLLGLGPSGQSEAQLLGPLRPMSLAFTLNLQLCHIFLNYILSYLGYKAKRRNVEISERLFFGT